MDRLVKRFDCTRDADLHICERGVAYQRDMSKRVAYDAAYLANYDAYSANAVSGALNAARVEMLARHVQPGSSVLDIGAASGVFVRAACAAGFGARGFDVIPEAVERLKAADLYADNAGDFDAVTMWDSIEHVDMPELYLKHIKKGSTLVTAIPVFEDLTKIRQSKHYKPGEHFYYWTADGFVDWMAMYGFRLVERSSHETELGRESIGAFAFRKDLPDYHDHILAYSKMHSERFYGSSATELHLNDAARVVRRIQPSTILDYGCGRSDLAAHFWKDGQRLISRYDPAIPAYKSMPGRVYDLVFCCDVMEHIPMAFVDRVLQEVRDRGRVAFFTISTKLARAKLPDGRNAHVTILKPNEWRRWIGDYFGPVEEMTSPLPHELVYVAGKP
jgi:2-polyprenyl-3-methyl-5-hydroxy-6-metoxy-1,4-benzoquinol methylase